jgi:hypothetical protein
MASGHGKQVRRLSAGYAPEERQLVTLTVLIAGLPFAVLGLCCLGTGLTGATDDLRMSHVSDAGTPRGFSILLGTVFLAGAVVLGLLLLRLFRSGAWLQGPILTVRGAFRDTAVDLSTADSVQVVRLNLGSGPGLNLVAKPAGTRIPVELPLRTRGRGGHIMPADELFALAEAAAPNPRAAPAVHLLRQLAANPLIYLL